MPINVTTIIAGPALVKFDGATFYSKGDIKLTTEHETFDVEVDRFRKVDVRSKEETIKIAFTPAGEWESLAVLYPYAATLLGSTITSDPNKALDIHTFAGKKLTFHNAALTKMPNIKGSAVETLLGEVEFEAFVKNNTAWSAANSRYTIATEALVDASFDPANILTQAYTVGWGAVAPWDAMSTKKGVDVDFSLALEPIETDADGIVSRRLSGLEVSVKCQPMGITEADMLNKLLFQGAGAVRGRSLSGDDLNVSAAGVYVRVYGAALKGGPQSFSSKEDRIGELEWMATRTFVAGAPNPLFFVGTEAPA